MKQLTSIYVALVSILLLLSFSILFLYYAQPFTAQTLFKQTLAYGDIAIEKGTMYNGEETLSSATAPLGILQLENKGYFSRVYTLPQFVGCIELSPAIQNTSLLRQNSFTITYLFDGVKKFPSNQVTLNVGDTKNLTIEGVYTSYNIPFSQFSRENILGISLYRLSEDQENPLRSAYADGRYYSGIDCSSLKTSKTPEVVISIR